MRSSYKKKLIQMQQKSNLVIKKRETAFHSKLTNKKKSGLVEKAALSNFSYFTVSAY